MAHAWDYGAIVGTTWHGQQDVRGATLLPGVSVPEGVEVSRIREVNWEKVPSFSLSHHTGKMVRIDGEYRLERQPRPWYPGEEAYLLPGRIVGEEYEVVQGADLGDLAENVAGHTGWTFMAAANLKDSEITFIQLNIDKDFRIGGKMHEAHKAKLFFGDDKGGGSLFGGITLTRIQCWNTWRAALSGEGVWRIRHDDNPKARLEFVAAQVVNAYKAMAEEEEWLNKFFVRPLPEELFERFVHDTFPDPEVTKSMIEAQAALEMVAAGQTNGFNVQKVIELGERSTKGYEQRLDLARRRRGYMEVAYEQHNREFSDSAEMFYAGAQALTQTTTHGPFQGNAEYDAMDGVRAAANQRGFNWLKEAYEDEE
jgi:hypothetical protein